jgi:hypothetical protein
MNYLYPMIYEEIENIHKVLLVPKFELQNFWFQQYESNDYHSWHNHFQSTYASVYYVELPDASVATEFKNPVTGEIIKPSVKEGDILTFPASIIHRSPPNNSGGRKTIIAINTIANVD